MVSALGRVLLRLSAKQQPGSGSRALHSLASVLQQSLDQTAATSTTTSSSGSSSRPASSSNFVPSTQLPASGTCWDDRTPEPCGLRAYSSSSSSSSSTSEQQGSTPDCGAVAAAAAVDPAVEAAKELTRAIRAAGKPGQLLQLVQQRRADLDPIHVSAVFTCARRMCGKDGSRLQDPNMQRLLQQLPALAQDVPQKQQQLYGARELGNIMCASAHLQLPGVVAALLPAVLRQDVLQGADALSIATALSSVEKLGMSLAADQVQQLFAALLAKPDVNMERIGMALLAAESLLKQQLSAEELQRCLEQMLQAVPAQDVSAAVAAAADRGITLAVVAAADPQQLLQLVHQHRADLSPVSVSAVFTRARSMCEQDSSRLQDPDTQRLLQQLPALAEGVHQQCRARELGNIMWASAHLQLPGVVALLLPALLQQDVLQGADAWSIANALWSVDRSGTSLAADQVQQLVAALLSKPDANSERICMALVAAESLLKQQLPAEQLQRCLQQMLQAVPAGCADEVRAAVAAAASMKLTRAIMAAAGPRQLLLLVQQHKAGLNHIHISAVFTCARRLCGEDSSGLQDPSMQQLRQELPALAEGVQQQCGARELGNILGASAHLQLPGVAAALLPALLQQDMLQEADARNVAEALWGLANSAAAPTGLQVQQLFMALLSKPDVDSQGISMAMRAMFLLQQPLSTEQLQSCIDKLLRALHTVSPQHINTVLGAANHMGMQVRTDQLQSLAGRLLQQLSDADADAIAHVLYACAHSGLRLPSQELGLLLARFTEQPSTPNTLRRLLWAVHRLDKHAVQAHAHYLEHVISHMMLLLQDASTLAICDALYVAAHLQLPLSQQQVGLVVDELTSEQRLHDCSPFVIMSVLRSVANLGVPGCRVPGAQLDALMSRLLEVLPDAKPEHIHNALAAVAAMGHQVPAEIKQPLLAWLGRSELYRWRP